jgi:hypothetical protein
MPQRYSHEMLRKKMHLVCPTQFIMKTTLKLEELVMFGASIYIFQHLEYAWWWYPALILLPDVSMLGYLFNPRVGAFTYNLGHHKGLALLALMIGFSTQVDELVLGGLILFGHSSLDRIMGYGLKYGDDFKHTHLGWLPGGGRQSP